MLGGNVVPNRLGYGMLGEWGPTDFFRGGIGHPHETKQDSHLPVSGTGEDERKRQGECEGGGCER